MARQPERCENQRCIGGLIFVDHLHQLIKAEEIGFDVLCFTVESCHARNVVGQIRFADKDMEELGISAG